VQVRRVLLDNTVQPLNEYAQGDTFELAFNLDEVGISDREDGKTRKITGRATMRSESIHYGISRNVKHIWAIACVFTAGKSVIPDTITSQDSASVREQLKKQGVWFRTDLVLKANPKLYIKPANLFDYTQTVFLPNLAEFGMSDEFAAEVAV
jgi:hypothetical protein